MRVKIQHCWNGHYHLYRAMICGGLRIRADSWNRKTAKQMLDLIQVELPHIKRSSIRFIHV